MSPAIVPPAPASVASGPCGPLFSLTNKMVAITGGGRGLGMTLAFAVVEAGGHAACIDILPSPSEFEWVKLNAAAKSTGVTVSYHKCDVTAESEVEAVFTAIAEDSAAKGAILSGVIACAGIQQKVPAVDYPAADFDRILRVNITGVFITAKYTARSMIASGTKGSIVLISSMSGQMANRGLTCTAYNSSKAAVQQMCRSLAQEWGQYGIRINTLSPGVSIRQGTCSRALPSVIH